MKTATTRKSRAALICVIGACALLALGCALPGSAKKAKAVGNGNLSVSFHLPPIKQAVSGGKAISPSTYWVKLYLSQYAVESYFGKAYWTPGVVTSVPTVYFYNIPAGTYDSLRLEFCDSNGTVLTSGSTNYDSSYNSLAFSDQTYTYVNVNAVPAVPAGNTLRLLNADLTVPSGTMAFYRVPIIPGNQYTIEMVTKDGGGGLPQLFLYDFTGAPAGGSGYVQDYNYLYSVGVNNSQTLSYFPTYLSETHFYLGVYASGGPAAFDLNFTGPEVRPNTISSVAVKKGVVVANPNAGGTLEYIYITPTGNLEYIKSTDGGYSWGQYYGITNVESTVDDFTADLDGYGRGVALFTFNGGYDTNMRSEIATNSWHLFSGWSQSVPSRYPSLYRAADGTISGGIGVDYSGINVADGFGIASYQFNPNPDPYSVGLSDYGFAAGSYYGGYNESVNFVDNPYWSQIFVDTNGTKLFLYSDNHWHYYNGGGSSEIGYAYEPGLELGWGSGDYFLMDPVTNQPSGTYGVSEPWMRKLDNGDYQLLYVADDGLGHRTLCYKVGATLSDLNSATPIALSGNDLAGIDYSSGPYRAYCAGSDGTVGGLMEVGWRTTSGSIYHVVLRNNDGSIHLQSAQLLAGNFMIDGISAGGYTGPFFFSVHDASGGTTNPGAPLVVKTQYGM